MDISSLSDDDFNAAEWINSNYKRYTVQDGGDGGEAKNVFVSSFVSKLQLYLQQVNCAMEDTSEDLMASMPRIVKDTKTLHADVQQLQQRMATVRKEVSAVQDETGDCMATLERLNNLQSKLQAAAESLQESDGWGNLLRELEDYFEKNDLQGVCDRMEALQKSLHAQEKLPGHAERQAQVEDIKNRLEALASPSVVQVFTEGNAELALKFVVIFGSIQRLPQLMQYYRAVQKNSLQQYWKETVNLSENSVQNLMLLYDHLVMNIQKQFRWCARVFHSEATGREQPFKVLVELLPSLQPARDQLLVQLLMSSNERLELLQSVSQLDEGFVSRLNNFFGQSDVDLSAAIMSLLSESVYEYFFKFINQYPNLEETRLSTQVTGLFVNQTSTFESVRQLADGTQKVFNMLTEACERCVNITYGLALCRLIAILGSVLKQVLDNFAKTQRQLSLSIAIGGENWLLLPSCMSLFECLADFHARLNRFERHLHERMSLLSDRIRAASKDMRRLSIYNVFDRVEIKRIGATIKEYQEKRTETVASSLGIFPSIYDALQTHFSETHDIALTILLQPIDVHLANIQPRSDSFTPNAAIEMPSFSFAPQECITQIGQYLLMLPQHLEPLLLAPSSLLKQALEMCNVRYAQQIPCADILLSLIVEQTCLSYQMQILHIKSLSAHATKQLAVDVEYLSSVVEELGCSVSVHLSQILTLLKAPPENYLSLANGCEPRLVTAIRQMRNILSTQ